MKNTINYLGTFGLVVMPIAFGIAAFGIYWITRVISNSIALY